MRRIAWLLFFSGVAMATTPVKRIFDQIQSTGGTAINVPSGGSWVGANQVQDTFSGNGSTVSFTLTHTPAAAIAVICAEDGLNQVQGALKDYTVSGATVTENTAPASGQTLMCYYNQY